MGDHSLSDQNVIKITKTYSLTITVKIWLEEFNVIAPKLRHLIVYLGLKLM